MRYRARIYTPDGEDYVIHFNSFNSRTAVVVELKKRFEDFQYLAVDIFEDNSESRLVGHKPYGRKNFIWR